MEKANSNNQWQGCQCEMDLFSNEIKYQLKIESFTSTLIGWFEINYFYLLFLFLISNKMLTALIIESNH